MPITKLERAFIAAFELDLNTVRVLLKADEFIAEYDFRCALDLLDQQP